ncbi:MAG: U32 family peptidase, partial [Victivallaceae bacterium]|nr:U32 family peptidase [Victivallaceae bacterium]
MESDFTPELLAPAGSPACALAAFDAGADAVYAGLAKFNARERGENFSPEMMAKIIDYAHANGKKVYVTLNTLVKESELSEIAETLALLSDLGPDALLVQDLGVLRMAREYFPELKLHASTQMGFHNRAGLRVAETLGFERVVLERQLTMEELESIRRSTSLELECFVHGALCCSLSGSCYFSSFLGGASGNRGKCKQPCRRRYFSRGGNGFFFSPQDLCGIEWLARFKKLRIESLKIEGRLRQSDYVGNVTAVYRRLLDLPAEEIEGRLAEARRDLSRAYGRRWSNGFYTAESARTLIRADAFGASGLRCGTVESIRDNGFGFTATARVGLGDRLRIQPPTGDDGVALTLTRIFVENRVATRARVGEKVFVCCDKPVAPGGQVFKIGESVADYTKRLAALPARRARLELAVTLDGKELTVAAVHTALPLWKKSLTLEKARNAGCGEEQLRREFIHADSGIFALKKLTATISGEWFFPAPLLKEARREFWRFVADRLKPESIVGDTGIALERFRRDYLSLRPAPLPGQNVETVAVVFNGERAGRRTARLAESVFELDKSAGEAILPDFCSERTLPALCRAIRAAIDRGVRRFRVTSLYAAALFRDIPEKVELVAAFPLPAANSMAFRELAELGFIQAMAHIELERSSVEALCERAAIPVELYRYGRP